MAKQTHTWRSVQKRCGLDDEEIRMAQKLGRTPEDVLRMIPNEKEKWKDRPALRIRRLYSRKYGAVC